MYVCICNGLNERAIDEAVSDGARSVGEVYRRNECTAECGQCAPEIGERLRRAQAAGPTIVESGPNGHNR